MWWCQASCTSWRCAAVDICFHLVNGIFAQHWCILYPRMEWTWGSPLDWYSILQKWSAASPNGGFCLLLINLLNIASLFPWEWMLTLTESNAQWSTGVISRCLRPHCLCYASIPRVGLTTMPQSNTSRTWWMDLNAWSSIELYAKLDKALLTAAEMCIKLIFFFEHRLKYMANAVAHVANLLYLETVKQVIYL